jgi:hypothetical protein
MRIIQTVAATLLILMTLADPTSATIIRATYSFTASGFEPEAPVDPVTGSFSVTFDNSLDVRDQASGVFVASPLNIAVGSQIGINYSPLDDTLTIGGLESGVNTIDGVFSDFAFDILNVSGKFTFIGEGDQEVKGPIFLDFFYSQSTGAVFSALTVVPIAEPTSLTLLTAGIIGLGLVRLRGKVSVARGGAVVHGGRRARTSALVR